MEEFLPRHIKTSEDEHNAPVVSADYLKRHKVSVAQLDEYQICAQSDASNPEMSWPEFAEIVTDVAFRWNSVDGKLANYDHFIKAVERRALRIVSKKKTETIFVTVKDKTSQALDNAGPDPKEIDEKYDTPWNDR